MLKQTLAAHFAFIFPGLLSSVTGSQGFSANNFGHDSLPVFISTFKEKCSKHFDPVACCYWDSFRYKISDSEHPNAFKTQRFIEFSPGYGVSERKISEKNSQEQISLETPENHLRKRFAVFRRKNPTARGYKRGPGFRSWGGKRNLMLSGENLDKKSKFASWGGKRNEEYLLDSLITSGLDESNAFNGRGKFKNGETDRYLNGFLEDIGKKEGESPISYDQVEKKGPIWKNRGFYMNEPFKKHVPKRPHFQSWGGKRGLDPWREFLGDLHLRPRFLLSGGEKRKFSSWGGKRYDDPENQFGGTRWRENEEEIFKRHGFQNWGGKRATWDADSLQDLSDSFKAKDSESSEETK